MLRRLLLVCILHALLAGVAFADSARAVEAFKAGDLVAAEREARAAIASGDGRGYEILAGLFMARPDREPDVEAAIATLREGFRAGWLRSNVVLAQLLRTLERGGKAGDGPSYALLLEAAERGFPPAQYFVAKEHEMLFMGYERAEDGAAALRWFREAVKSPSSLDMEEVSVTGQQVYCDVGWRIETMLKSAADAIPWYQRCADAGCGAGMDKLAELHPDPAVAARWRKAGESAKPEACLNN